MSALPAGVRPIGGPGDFDARQGSSDVSPALAAKLKIAGQQQIERKREAVRWADPSYRRQMASNASRRLNARAAPRRAGPEASVVRKLQIADRGTGRSRAFDRCGRPSP
jgi:hypothetical protein